MPYSGSHFVFPVDTTITYFIKDHHTIIHTKLTFKPLSSLNNRAFRGSANQTEILSLTEMLNYRLPPILPTLMWVTC